MSNGYPRGNASAFVGSFFIHALLDGTLNCLGLLFTSMLEFFDSSVATTSLVPALINSLLNVYSPLTYAIVKHRGDRQSAISGGILMSLSLCSCYFIHKLKLVQVVLGLFFTFGMSLASSAAFIALQIDVPNEGSGSDLMRKHVRLFSALAFAGGGIGEMTFPLLGQLILTRFNWQETALILGAVSLNISAFGYLLSNSKSLQPAPDNPDGRVLVLRCRRATHSFRKRYASNRHSEATVGVKRWWWLTAAAMRRLIDLRVLKSGRFWLFAVSSSVSMMVQTIPLVFLADHIAIKGIGMRADIAYSLIGVQAIVSELLAGFVIDGRFIQNWLVYLVWTVLCGCSCLFLLLWPSRVISVVMFAILYGFGVSFNYVITIALMGELFDSESRYTAYGIVEMAQGLLMLLAIPVAGVLRDRFGDYRYGFSLTFLLKMLSAAMMILWPIMSQYERNTSCCRGSTQT